MPHLYITHKTGKFLDRTFPIVHGRSGISSHKQEGDGATPSGVFPLRRVFYNPTRIALPPLKLPTCAITHSMGWSDDSRDPLYNQLVTLPHPYSHEVLWREDHLYDVFVEVGYNDAPAIPSRGSAIFLHLPPSHDAGTAGCIAIEKTIFLSILVDLDLFSTISIAQE